MGDFYTSDRKYYLVRKIGKIDWSNGLRLIKTNATNHVIRKNNCSSLPRHDVSSKSGAKQLNVLALNCQSIRETAPILHDKLKEDFIDIAILTETWLKPEGDEAFIKSLVGNEFKMFSFPRLAGHGYGGVAFVIKNYLVPHSTCKRLNFLSMEAAELKLKIGKKASTFVAIYRLHPNKNIPSKLFFDEFPTILSNYSTQNCDFHFHGDFNLHYNKPDTLYVSRMLSILDDHNLIQLVNKPTHRCGNILDWTIIRKDSSLLNFQCVKKLPGLSDHFGIFSSLDMKPPIQNKHYISTRNIKDIDLDAFRSQVQDLVQNLCCPQNFTHDVSLLVDSMNDGLKLLLDKHAPLYTKLVRDRTPAPWKTEAVKEAKRKARRAERKWRKTGLTVDEQIYKSETKKYMAVSNKARKKYNSDKINDCSTTKEIHSVSDALLGKSKRTPLPTNIDKSDLPQHFSDYFIEKIKKIRKELDKKSDGDLSFDIYHGTCLNVFEEITEEELNKIISSMPSKTCSLDPLPTSLTKILLPELLPLIIKIINLSLCDGIVPNSFKEALVIPLLKKPNLDCNEMRNFRPVSNLPFLSKVLERVVLHQLLSHLYHNNLLETFQSAYRIDHSTETAVLSVVNDLLLQCDNHNVSIMALLDLSAAFDTIDHNILMERLKKTYGLDGLVLQWFKSYLDNRSQFVNIDSIKSSTSKIECGVPQGSVLGPILFSLYTQPLSDVISKNDCKFHKFADDTEVMKSSTLDNFSSTKDEVSKCISDISSWMSSNKLKLNPDKTEVLATSTTHLLKEVKNDTILLEANNLPIQTSVRYLGVKIDSSLSMSLQINAISKSCFLELRRISSIRKFLSHQAVKTLVCSKILPRLDYCNSIFIGMTESNFKRLQRIQNCAAKLIYKKKKFDHVTPLLRDLHWLPVRARCIYKIAVLTYKFFEGSLPKYLSDLLTVKHNQRILRSSSQKLLTRPKCLLKNFGERSFYFNAPKIWNDLPASVRNAPSIETFKKHLKTHLFIRYL